MWKSIVLCVSLFGGAALGLSVGARFVEPAALPAAAAIGLCLIGVVLILAAPTAEEGATETMAPTRAMEKSSGTEPSPTAEEGMEVPSVATVSNRTPALPLEAVNS